MKLSVPVESEPTETRVAVSPEMVKRFIALGFSVSVGKGAGLKARITDEAYKEAGASLATPAKVFEGADLVLKVRRPSIEEIKRIKPDTIVVGIMDPFDDPEALESMAKAGLTSVAMELMPRITRAQSMDVLSSQANLAGYQAVIDGAFEFDRALPMMMTAAGTVPAARVFVMGAGVAGLQAVATAKRLGAVVSATDVRPAAKEQVESLGGKFIAVEDDEFRQAETSGGYAKEMSDDYKKKQSELVASHIARQDIVITTALIPGRPAPKLISKAMLESMRPGSVVVDLAVERGGNCELAQVGKVIEHKGVRIIGHHNVPGRIAATASQLYAKNLYTFVETLIDKDTKTLNPDWNDELLSATVLTRGGAIIHPMFAPKAVSK